MAEVSKPDIEIVRCDAAKAEAAAGLLLAFFREEGFAGSADMIAAHLAAMLADEDCWVALARREGSFVGIVTVTTMRDIEHGRLAEIGDLYVRPRERGAGIARALMASAIAWCREAGCRAVLATIAASGESETAALIGFYRARGFLLTDRRIAKLDLSQ